MYLFNTNIKFWILHVHSPHLPPRHLIDLGRWVLFAAQKVTDAQHEVIDAHHWGTVDQDWFNTHPIRTESRATDTVTVVCDQLTTLTNGAGAVSIFRRDGTAVILKPRSKNTTVFKADLIAAATWKVPTSTKVIKICRIILIRLIKYKCQEENNRHCSLKVDSTPRDLDAVHHCGITCIESAGHLGTDTSNKNEEGIPNKLTVTARNWIIDDEIRTGRSEQAIVEPPEWIDVIEKLKDRPKERVPWCSLLRTHQKRHQGQGQEKGGRGDLHDELYYPWVGCEEGCNR